MSAIYFMGLVPEFEDDEWDHERTCSCTAALFTQGFEERLPAIRITTRKGGQPTAECPACHQAYTVMVEGPGRGDMWPVHPGQII